MNNAILASVVIPVFNEEKNIKPLFSSLQKNLANLKINFEIIFIDDGSTDNSHSILKEIESKYKEVTIISHRKNLGKTFALQTGFNSSKGKIVVTMDSDLQNDPSEIGKFIEKVSQGYDLVLGRRIKRKDSLYRVIFSNFTNIFIRLFFGFKFNDFYCGFKCYRRAIIKDMNLCGDLYRFIPLIAYQRGFRLIEIPIKHYPRNFGKSKYAGLKLFNRAFCDFEIILFMVKFRQISSLAFSVMGTVFILIGLWASHRLGDAGLAPLFFGLLLTSLGFISYTFREGQRKRQEIYNEN